MKNNPKFSLSAFALALTGLAFFAPQVMAMAVPAVVGDATLVIGVVRLASADGTSRPVARGTSIHEGDRIETDAGGHVHLRFVDGGRISVRPSSRLQIENYSHSEQQPAISAIKFRLDEGVVRSITGRWGEAARDRFRLNTPVAAIGVKGTDFVVTTDADKTLASVYTGAIVLTPLSDGCQGTLGPCQNGNEKLLSGSMRGQMVALYREQAAPQIVASAEFLTQAQSRRTDVAAAPTRQDLPRIDVAADHSAPNTVQIAAASTSQATATILQTEPVAPPPVTPQPPVTVPEPLQPPQVTQLVWARAPWVQAIDGDALSVAFDAANQAGRSGTVGNGAYSLFRNGPSNGLLVTGDAKADFRLAGGVAQLAMAEGRVIEPVKVGTGTLSVDFSRATFETSLNVSSPSLGVDNLAANGIVKPNGVLLGQGGNAYVAGSLSLDSKEAGYFFEKTVPKGALSGISLWGR